MKLIVKFNLVLTALFAVAFVLAGWFTHMLLQRNARNLRAGSLAVWRRV